MAHLEICNFDSRCKKDCVRIHSLINVVCRDSTDCQNRFCRFGHPDREVDATRQYILAVGAAEAHSKPAPPNAAKAHSKPAPPDAAKAHSKPPPPTAPTSFSAPTATRVTFVQPSLESAVLPDEFTQQELDYMTTMEDEELFASVESIRLEQVAVSKKLDDVSKKLDDVCAQLQWLHTHFAEAVAAAVAKQTAAQFTTLIGAFRDDLVRTAGTIVTALKDQGDASTNQQPPSAN